MDKYTQELRDVILAEFGSFQGRFITSGDIVQSARDSTGFILRSLRRLNYQKVLTLGEIADIMHVGHTIQNCEPIEVNDD